ncbi:hypothetical protein NLJ89_g8272 [Agrocybe chaxingu]|uniref:Maltase n=1 Tax=Agrocybe chaxingu TaxID=84603 RepID=A0A9W8MUN4_9AGAR|nr:hypothetical protein NLJ89_g8272 [Agrocybe chaxingu]
MEIPPSSYPWHSRDIAKCPGYELHSLKHTNTGLTARLSLAGTACNAFGTDVSDLTIKVAYETRSRLHVNIFDTADKQYTIPNSVIMRPPPPTQSFAKDSDLVFNYEPSPFAFWITRRSQPDATPLFDTRITSLPKTPISPVIPGDNSTALDGFPLVFEDQYLQLASALPPNANIYGLGEVIASSGFRRNIGPVNGTIQTMWTRDVSEPVDENLYGAHPVYLEHRSDPYSTTSQSHGVFLLSAAGGDILLLTPPSSNVSLVEYRMIGGVLDFYFFSGPTPNEVIEQYGALIGLPTWQPAWGFGFHLCRWGYKDLDETREQVTRMREANIPLEVMWNDIDLYHAVRDFTSDPVNYPGDKVREFIRELNANNQHYIPIVDAAIPKQINATDLYHPYTKGVEEQVFITNPDGTEYVGQVWPGYTVFPDWFQKNTQQWWTDAFRNWSESGIEFSGIWLDMNEASSFCDGSCGTGANLTNTSVPFILPGEPGHLILDYPECYNATIFGPSGNITVNGTLTCRFNEDATPISSINKRGLGAGKQRNVDLNTPPYVIHNGFGRLSTHALATNATHAQGQVELDVHNLWGLMEQKATHLVLQDIIPGKRPFIISRSTFPSSGRWTGHWYTLFANSSINGTPPVRALFFEFPNEPELFDVDTQFLVGADILVTPVLEPNVSIVSGFFPGRGEVIWRDWYTHNVVNSTPGAPTTLSAPLGHINVHIRDGSALLLHSEPRYTIAETRQGPYSLLVSLNTEGVAYGSAYIDDGISYPPGPHRTLTFSIRNNSISITSTGSFLVGQKLQDITVLGVNAKPKAVDLNRRVTAQWLYTPRQNKLVMSGIDADLNDPVLVEWK